MDGGPGSHTVCEKETIQFAMEAGNPIHRNSFCDWGLCRGALLHFGRFVNLDLGGHRGQVIVYTLGSDGLLV